MERIFKKNEDGNLIVECIYTPEEKKSFEREILESSAEMMLSEDYKERFIAEYRQTKLRFMRLGEMLDKYKKGTLGFKPTCSIELLEEQWTDTHPLKKCS